MSILTFSKLGQFGRLGNCLFQIASTVGIARKNGLQPYFPIWNHAVYFDMPFPSLQKYQESCEVKRGYKIINEPSFKYNEINLPNKEFNYDLLGYFQSEKYFIDVKSEIRNMFTIMGSLKKVIYQRYPIITYTNYTTVSIHIRRGDYVNLTDYHTNLVDNSMYYERSLGIIGRQVTNPFFVVFSDDYHFASTWAKEKLSNRQYTVINDSSEITTLFLMSQCRHHITANSSFSWWGSWLSDFSSKIVIMPLQWFGPKGPKEHSLYPDRCTVT